ncbi:MAG TPA: S8 family serine peptidase [Acidimicrobiales bacterium]|nr:S8 family serine peptidase [Acidimicrobiales bacterium]
MRSTRLALGAVTAVMVTFALPAAPAHSEADGEQLVVRVRDGAASDVAAAAHGVLGDRVMPGVWRLRVPKGRAAAALARMRGHSKVVWAERDGTVRAAATPNDPCFDSRRPECRNTEQWGLRKVNAPAAWDITRGNNGVKVAVLDTGVTAAHPDLLGKVTVGPNRSDSPTSDDLIGHGTHVAGVIAANTDNATGVAGLGWNTTILSVKVLDEQGEGDFSDVAQAVHDSVSAGARVINMSFASPTFSSVMRDAIADARAAGVLVVAATGNEFGTDRTYPAALDGVVSVVATDRDDAVPAFANRGTWASIGAPGVDIVSTWRTGYEVHDGTSMAAPHVSAAAALVFAANPGFTGDQVRARLGESAVRVPATGSAFQWGRLDALGALRGGNPGYWMVASDGGIFSFGAAGFHGSAGGTQLLQPVVSMAASPTKRGYWLVSADGGVFSYGDARFAGSLGNVRLNASILGIEAHPSGTGYWMVASDGGVFTFGDARFFGSTGNIRLNQPIVGMAATPGGRGYWMVARDGGIFAFGDARFFGSTGNIVLNQPVVGMAPTPTGKGYWLVASDGGMFAFGDARFFGSTGNIRLNQPIVGMRPTPTGNGYWLVARDGGIFAFGDARFLGSMGGTRLNQPIVGMAS